MLSQGSNKRIAPLQNNRPPFYEDGVLGNQIAGMKSKEKSSN